jgi:nucleoside-diphosphate-sugar epimerase
MNEKLIVVVGAAGKLGQLVVESVLEHAEARVRALVRDPSKPEAGSLKKDRVEVVAFDAVHSDAAARAAAVQGAYTVVSTLQGGPDVIVDAQLALVRAAKAAGARRFIPSGYSIDYFALPDGINFGCDMRRTLGLRAREEITEAFEVVHVLQGMFADRFVLGFVGMFDAERGVVRYWGDGTTPIDWTTWEDTARFTAAAALDDTRVPERLFVSGDRMSMLEFADAWGRIRGRTPERERLGSLAELEQETKRRIAAEPRNMMAWLPLQYARGVFGGEALLGASHNDRYPSIHPLKVVQAIERGAL